MSADRRAARAWCLVPTVLAAILVAAAPARAQGVLLQIHPRLGDTLRMRLDQEVEMSGTARVAGADSTVNVTTVMRVLARSVVERSDTTGTTILAVTDSVSVRTTGGAAPAALDGTRGSLQGRRVHLRVAPDGTTQVMDDGDDLEPQLAGLFAQMPATLPVTPVSVGDRWTSTMAIPSAGQRGRPGGPRTAGTMTATFRLDSLTRGGDVAHISMRGALSRGAEEGSGARGVTLAMTGLVTGAVVLDRRRGWLTDARTTLTVRSVVTPPAGSTAQPMRFRMKVTQWLRTM